MLFCPETATCWSAGCGADRNSPACLHTRPLIHVCLAAGNSARRTGHRQKALSRSAGRRLGPSAALGIEPVEIALQPGSRPILSGGGGGIFFFWQLGIIKYLEEHFDLTKVEARGASAGALVATLAVCNADPHKALDLAHSLSVDAGLFDRKLKLAGVWGGLIRAWLYGLLPPNAPDLIRGRLKLVVTDIRQRLRQVAITDFENIQDLVEANMASVHVPFFLDYKAFAHFRGRPYVDGSLADFVRGDNSALLVAEGKAVVLDYFMDDQLQYKRMDFLKLPSHEQAVALMEKGYAYAKRVEASGEYEQKFGTIRRK